MGFSGMPNIHPHSAFIGSVSRSVVSMSVTMKIIVGPYIMKYVSLFLSSFMLSVNINVKCNINDITMYHVALIFDHKNAFSKLGAVLYPNSMSAQQKASDKQINTKYLASLFSKTYLTSLIYTKIPKMMQAVNDVSESSANPFILCASQGIEKLNCFLNFFKKN